MIKVLCEQTRELTDDSYFSVNPRTPASRWHRLQKQKQKKINF